MNDSAIDIKELLARVEDDKDLILELLDIFREDFEEKRAALRQAVQAKNFEQVNNVAHSLKGSSGNISAKTMHATCLKIEQLAEAGDANGIQEALAVLDQAFADVQADAQRIKKDFEG